MLEGINGLKITGISIFPVNSSGRLVAMVRVVLNESIQLTGLRIYKSSVDVGSGLFVSYPLVSSEKGEDVRQVFYPTTKELRTYMEDTILIEYERVLTIQRGQHD